MIDKKYNLLLIIIFISLTLSLVSALVIEYGLGHKACKLCIYQRYPYLISILLMLSIFILEKNVKIHLLILSIISLIGAGIAFYHFGIEKGFFEESSVCEIKNSSQVFSKEDILKQLDQNTISCKEVNFRFLGLSLASINTIFSIVLSYIFFKIFRNYENNK